MPLIDDFESLYGTIPYINPFPNDDSVANELLAEEIRLMTRSNMIQNKGNLYIPPSIFAAPIHKGK